MELIALKKLSNGIKPGERFTERDPKIVNILLAIGVAMVADEPPEQSSVSEGLRHYAQKLKDELQPPPLTVRRRGRPRKTALSEPSPS